MCKRGNINIEAIVVRDIKKVSNQDLLDFKFIQINDDVLKGLSSKYVYIATPISTHYNLIELALLNGKNVICEKPVCVEIEKLNYLYDLAKDKKLALNQVLMYKYHKAYDYLKKIIDTKAYGTLVSVESSFKIPHLHPSDIRYNKAMLGGAKYDVGFYPLSLAFLLSDKVTLLESSSWTDPKLQVDLKGGALFDCNGFVFKSMWSIGSDYENYVKLKFDTNIELVINRFFSKPHDYVVTAEISNYYEQGQVVIGSDDQFLNMFENYLSSKDSIDVGFNLDLTYLFEEL